MPAVTSIILDVARCGALSRVGLGLFGLDGILDFHVVKFLGIKNFAAFQAFDKFNIIVPGNDAHSRVFANGRHGVGGFLVRFDLYCCIPVGFQPVSFTNHVICIHPDPISRWQAKQARTWYRTSGIRKAKTSKPFRKQDTNLILVSSGVLFAPDCNHLRAKRKRVFFEYFPCGEDAWDATVSLGGRLNLRHIWSYTKCGPIQSDIACSS